MDYLDEYLALVQSLKSYHVPIIELNIERQKVADRKELPLKKNVSPIPLSVSKSTPEKFKIPMVASSGKNTNRITPPLTIDNPFHTIIKKALPKHIFYEYPPTQISHIKTSLSYDLPNVALLFYGENHFDSKFLTNLISAIRDKFALSSRIVDAREIEECNLWRSVTSMNHLYCIIVDDTWIAASSHGRCWYRTEPNTNNCFLGSIPLIVLSSKVDWYQSIDNKKGLMESTLSHSTEALSQNYSQIALVFLDVAIDKPLNYGIPQSLEDKLTIGMRVQVTLRGRPVKALVIDIKSSNGEQNLQPIMSIESLDIVLSKELFKLAEFICAYYATPIRKVFHTILPSTLRTDIREKQQFFVKRRISCKKIISLCIALRQTAPSQAALLDTLLQFPKGLLATELLAKSRSTRGTLLALEKKGIVSLNQIAIDRSIIDQQEYFPTLPKTLHSEQKSALDHITRSLHTKSYQTFLLHGITGSGKTEIYLQAIDYARKLGYDVIFLVPEIALTTQTIERVRCRFSEPIAVLHHRLSHGQRLDTWRSIQSGKIHIAIGARSAVFSPFPKLGLLIVDEEHDASYKQTDEMPCYHARDVAVARANIVQATVILGSATPSFESYQNAEEGKYTKIILSDRPNSSALPKIYTVNMTKEFEKEKRFTLFSSALLTGIQERFERGEQTILFLNRRGYHTSQGCTVCKEVVGCPHCAIRLTFHRGDNMLSCHLCGYTLSPPPSSCLSCKSSNTMKFRGIGTEAVEKSLHAILPEVRTIRLDADTTKHKGSHDRLWKQFKSGKADVLIGTQMVAKGLHFPAVTLVGIIHMDAHIHIPDFRSSETAFQLLCQVSGRSGRSMLPGEVIIQTHMENHPVIQMAINSDVDTFFKEESISRKLFDYPPFTHLTRILFSGKCREQTFDAIQNFRKLLIEKLPNHYIIHAPIPCSYAKIKDHYRFHFLIRGKKVMYLGKILMELMPQFYIPNKLRVIYDVDPISTFFNSFLYE